MKGSPGTRDMQDAMTNALVELLEETGFLKADEWDHRIKRNLEKK
jgi:hypothetical protein